jgi:hypothetical protein
MGILLAILFGIFVLFMLVLGWRIREPSPRVGIKPWVWWLGLLLVALLVKSACGIHSVSHPDRYDF